MKRFHPGPDWVIGSALALLLLSFPVGAYQEIGSLASWSAADLLQELVILEEGGGDLDAAAARSRLEEFARRAVHASIEVHVAYVTSLYQRDADWLTRPYFALSYDRESYVYLDEIDSVFQTELAHHPRWASVVYTTTDRQLMFEMALDRSAFEQLQVGCRIRFTCELAGVIRGGKSVYCRALTVRVLDCDSGES